MSPIKISGIIRWQEKERERLDYTRLETYIYVLRLNPRLVGVSFGRGGSLKTARIHRQMERQEKYVKIYADTMGPQLRTRLLRDGPVNVVVLHTEISEANKAVPDLFEIGRD